MKIAIISVGNEILNGSIVDTNSNFIASKLTEMGFCINTIMALSDDANDIRRVFEEFSHLYDIVITTGGLGPTFDDNTIEGLAYAAKAELKLNREIYKDVLKKVSKKGVKLKLSHIKQAYLPSGCEIIKNDYGTACGILIKINKAYFISMPGVPSEMKPMFENYVIPKINELFKVEKKYRYDLKLIGVPESDMDEFLKSMDLDDVDVILNAQEGELAVRIFSYDKNKLIKIKDSIFKHFGYKLYAENDESIEDVVDGIMRKYNLKLGIIESFSGGYLSLLMSDKESFVTSIVDKREDLDNFTKLKDVDLIISPSSLQKNNFVVNIYYKNELKQYHVKYMGNRNFMKKSVSKRTLGCLFEFLKSLDF